MIYGTLPLTTKDVCRQALSYEGKHQYPEGLKLI